MTQLMNDLFTAQPDILFMIAGLVLIGVGVVGSIKTYIDPGKYGRIAALAIGLILLCVGFGLYYRQASQAAVPPPPAKPAVASSICTFDTGPLAGSTSQLPETDLGSVGSPCQDSAGNKGILVAPDTPVTTAKTTAGAAAGTAQPPTPTPTTTPPPSPPAQQRPSGPSRLCTFKSGPAAGATHELPRARLQAIGSPCHDLKGDSGVIVAAGTPVTP
jgi:hypothetical protein